LILKFGIPLSSNTRETDTVKYTTYIFTHYSYRNICFEYICIYVYIYIYIYIGINIQFSVYLIYIGILPIYYCTRNVLLTICFTDDIRVYYVSFQDKTEFNKPLLISNHIFSKPYHISLHFCPILKLKFTYFKLFYNYILSFTIYSLLHT